MAVAEFVGTNPDVLYVVEYGVPDRKFRVYTSEGQALRKFSEQEKFAPKMYIYKSPELIGKVDSLEGR